MGEILKPTTTKNGSTALAPVASTLEEARPGAMFFLNGRGDVISPRRARWMMVAACATRALLGAFLLGFCASLFGWVGALAGSGYLVFGLWNLRDGLRAVRASRLIASDPARAEAILMPLARGRWRVPWVRGGAHMGLAHAAALRGDNETALAHFRAAQAAYAKTDEASGPHARSARHGEVIALVNLKRIGEARATLNVLGPLPVGNYLRLERWTCELYVCFAEGAHAIDPDDLHQRSRAGLGLSSGGTLVALCAWAHAQRGDHDQAAHLLAEAGERVDVARLQTLSPKLHAWMTGYASGGGGGGGGAQAPTPAT